MDFNTKIDELNKVGKTIAKRLSRLNILIAKDLLFHFPSRYEDYSLIKEIKDLKIGEKINIIGKIKSIENKKSPHKRIDITEAVICSNWGSLKVVWFNQPYIKKTLKIEDTISVFGKIENNYNTFVMHPTAYEKIKEIDQTNSDTITPIYHLTDNISQKQLRFLIKQVIKLVDKIEDALPTSIQNKLNLIPLEDALLKIHFPKITKDIQEARKRLAFDELFFMQLKSQIIKESRKKETSEIIKFKEKETKEFVESLPFKLTNDQKKSAWQILKDIEKSNPMSRLLDGDVGSGKTMVAIIAMLNTALNNKQSVIMTPTELLAKQHFHSISKILKPLKHNIKIALLTSNEKIISNNKTTLSRAKNKEKILKSIKKGEVDIVIGTSALLQDNVIFSNLALSIIDEQHRFGVNQRKTLIKKSGNNKTTPHFLSMTATPIPRSLALALFGDLDISIIREKPKTRKQIITKIITEKERKEVYNFIESQVKKEKQIFIICPLIEESDTLEVKSVKDEFIKLNKYIFPNIPIAMLHGKMKGKEKEKIMQDFLNKKYKILVSTSVIEVGIDIPNASVILIEGAERFGLAQLHQFRGRVGRGDNQSYCFFSTKVGSPTTFKRLSALVASNDGFQLAKKDLEIRGAGEIYGTAQKGFPELKIATLYDYELICLAKKEAEELIKKDPDLSKNQSLKKNINNWLNTLHLE